MKIGELARRTGVTAKTIRYYEDIGLVPEPDRDFNDYRDYSEQAVELLLFIRDAQATGLTLTEIGSILELRSEGLGTCAHVIELLERHVKDLDRHLKELRNTRRQLADLTARAQALDHGDCTDPIRCHTIAVGTRENPPVREPISHRR
jgi:DNA-binding transcriptional MerR regulator